MSVLELLLIAVGLSMDAFAVAVCKGLSMQKANYMKALIVGLYFGIFQAVMPLIGYLVGLQFSETISRFDHWITFGLLSIIGTKMILDSFGSEDHAGKESTGGKHPEPEDSSLKFGKMLPLAVATSIDALAVGVSFAVLQVRIIPAISFIGVTTLVLSMVGVKIGNIFGTRLKSKAELAGGCILILIGLKILLEHLGILIL